VFRLAALPAAGHTGVVQAFSDAALSVNPLPTGHPGRKRFFGYELVIPINQHGVDSADVLMNSAFGRCGTKIGELVFVGGKGDFYRFPLVEGVNIRDHNYATFCNTITRFQGEANYGNVRLDFQRIQLPEKISSSLEAIVFRGFRKGSFSGAPFIAAITLHISDPQASSTIQYGQPVPTPDVSSGASGAQSCVTDAIPCTPADASITKEGPTRYRIMLPANLVLGAAIPNPNHVPVKVHIEGGVVCVNTAPNGCFSANQNRAPAGSGFMDPSLPAGALLWVDIGSETVFSVNGQLNDEVPIEGSNAKMFRDYRGGISFVATIP
jgi:hypothetical protein